MINHCLPLPAKTHTHTHALSQRFQSKRCNSFSSCCDLYKARICISSSVWQFEEILVTSLAKRTKTFDRFKRTSLLFIRLFVCFVCNFGLASGYCVQIMRNITQSSKLSFTWIALYTHAGTLFFIYWKSTL